MNYWTFLAASIFFYAIPSIAIIFNLTKPTNQTIKIMTGIGLLFHTFFIYIVTFSNGFNFNFANTFLIITSVIILISLTIRVKALFKGLELFALIPAIFILICHPILQQGDYVNYLSANASMHIMMGIISYSLLAFGAILSFFLLCFEENLHPPRLNSSFLKGNLSLLNIELILFRFYWFGFLLLSLTLISGFFFSNYIFGKPIVWNHKLIFSLFAWSSYATLLFGRITYGWRGKKAIIISLIAFVFLFLAYFGTKFVLEILLNR
jgi:ABC-type uncharacterized transport system permease subunit|tara:strand:+ start:3956 stop:4750 length:795 start_codon:yes stop_codon:yes gene_type:complete